MVTLACGGQYVGLKRRVAAIAQVTMHGTYQQCESAHRKNTSGRLSGQELGRSRTTVCSEYPCMAHEVLKGVSSASLEAINFADYLRLGFVQKLK